MRRAAFILAATGLLACQQVCEQGHVCDDPALEQQLANGGYVHSVLPLDYSSSMEALYASKTVLSEMPVAGTGSRWSHSGYGCLRAGEGDGVELVFPNLTGKRATGSPDDPDYATYGESLARLDLEGVDASLFNRLHFRVYPDCEGARVVGLILDFSGRATHFINLRNHQWNDVWFEYDEYDKSGISYISLSSSIKGRDVTTGEEMHYRIRDISFQQVADPEKTSGWEPMDSRIVYSTSGYLPASTKTAIVSSAVAESARRFSIVDSKSGKNVFSGTVTPQTTSIGSFGVLDFSSFTREGEYILRVGNLETAPFRISRTLWQNTQWRLVNYVFAQRCGYSVPGVHGSCHADLMADHGGVSISYAGGWHDAGDLSQQTLQTGDVAYALLEASNSLKSSNPVLSARLLEEARWGLDHILKCRFSDGYRASSMGLLHWTDGRLGTYDDIHTVRTQNNALDNFLYAAYEAYAAMSIPDDPAMAEHLRKIAADDFSFALEKFRTEGFDNYPHIMEHVYNTSECQFMASASWSASMMYMLTAEEAYAALAAEFADYVVECQHVEPLADGSCGFFYRNASREVPVHFIHQSRDQIFAQALELVCRTQRQHPSFGKWESALRMYAGYLKGMMKYTLPYGMIPSGVHREGEYNDWKSFSMLHIFAPSDARERFDAQIRKGVDIGGGYYIRRFPAWFNIYNGNTAINLSTGKAAAICGRYFNDEELKAIALEQLYWTVGKNPFGQSLVFGEGARYPQLNSFSSGEIVGEIPVGIRSIGDEDVPYFPVTNNACYKEVWVTSAGKMLSLISEFNQ